MTLALMSLIIRGGSENKDGLALSKAFKVLESEGRIIKCTSVF